MTSIPVNSNEFIERTEARIDEILDELQGLISSHQQLLNEKLLQYPRVSGINNVPAEQIPAPHEEPLITDDDKGNHSVSDEQHDEENNLEDSGIEASIVEDSVVDDSVVEDSVIDEGMGKTVADDSTKASTNKRSKVKLRICAMCGDSKPKPLFSGIQWRTKPPRCKECISKQSL